MGACIPSAVGHGTDTSGGCHGNNSHDACAPYQNAHQPMYMTDRFSALVACAISRCTC